MCVVCVWYLWLCVCFLWYVFFVVCGCEYMCVCYEYMCVFVGCVWGLYVYGACVCTCGSCVVCVWYLWGVCVSDMSVCFV